MRMEHSDENKIKSREKKGSKLRRHSISCAPTITLLNRTGLFFSASINEDAEKPPICEGILLPN